MTHLPKGNTELSKDVRPIKSVYWASESDLRHAVGDRGCTRIEAYDESGHMARVPWIAVFRGDEIAVRFPADQITVYYY